MKKIMLFIALLVFGMSCQEKGTIESKVDFSENNIDVRSIRTKGEIPYDTNTELKSLLQDTDNHTWQELDAYYKNVVLKTMNEKDYFMNLQNVVFKRLVTSYNFLEHAPIETIEFYLDDQSKVEYNAFPVFLAKALNSVKDKWSYEKINSYVDKNLQKTVSYVQKTFDDPQDLISRSKHDHDYLKGFARNLELPKE